MIEKTYTESALRTKLEQKTEQMIEGLMGRLRDDGFFKEEHIFTNLQSRIGSDGSMTIDGEPIRKEVQDFVHVLLLEFFKEILVALFEEDDNAAFIP